MKTETTQPCAGQTQHSALPWDTQRAVNLGGMPEPAIHIRDESGRILATVKATRQFVDAKHLEANAGLICRAVNSHADLLAALKLAQIVVVRAVRAGQCPSGLENTISAAIAKATQP